MLLRGGGDRQILSGMRFSKTSTGERLEMLLRGSQQREILFGVRREETAGIAALPL